MTTRTAPQQRDAAPAAARSLVSLLGQSRAAIVEHLRHVPDASVAELADHLSISEVATRRHVGVLEDEGLLEAQTVNQGRGRPAARYQLTSDADRLYPSAYDQFAAEALDFLGETQGRAGVRAFLKWRLERQVAELSDAVTADDVEERLGQLAEALSAVGFSASVDEDERGFTLTQDHCAIADVAREHPEVCAFEAATFAEVLGRDVHLRRRATMTGGADRCVCCVTPRDAAPGDDPAVVPDDLPTSGRVLPVVGSDLHDHPEKDEL